MTAETGPDIAKDAEERRQWQIDFEAAARRPLEERLRYAYVKTYKPVMDDTDFRSFDTMAKYRQWCNDNLPKPRACPARSLSQLRSRLFRNSRDSAEISACRDRVSAASCPPIRRLFAVPDDGRCAD